MIHEALRHSRQHAFHHTRFDFVARSNTYCITPHSLIHCVLCTVTVVECHSVVRIMLVLLSLFFVMPMPFHCLPSHTTSLRRALQYA